MDQPIILKIFLIGFHHKKGCSVNLDYPQDNENSKKYNIDIEKLPSLCLPDQSHNYETDSVYFILPDCENERIFGVSCFRQIETEKLTNRIENDGSTFMRNSVQKAVCCLSRLPLFGYIEARLNIIVDKIFEQGDFKCEELLRESYNELNRCLSLRIDPKIDEDFISRHEDFIDDFFIGICLRELIILWRHKIIMLFKLFLLEKRILFYGSPVKPCCTTILSIITLHPNLLNKGLCDVFEPKLNLKEKDDSELNEKLQNSENDEADITKAQPTIMRTANSSDWFAPMQIFKNNYLCLPFISLQYIDIIADKAHNGFIAGASNVLFQQKKNLLDVLIDVPSQTIDFIDLELKKSVQLTTEDLRFFEHLIKGIESPKHDEFQTGTDTWIRKQFESYFTSMLRTNYDSENQKDLESFNEYFMEDWRKTNNYQDWLAKKITFVSSNSDITTFDSFPKGHPFARTNNSMNVSDVKNKIVQSIHNTAGARKTVTAVTATFSNAKSTFSTWFSNLSVKEELSKDIIDMEERDKVESVDN